MRVKNSEGYAELDVDEKNVSNYIKYYTSVAKTIPEDNDIIDKQLSSHIHSLCVAFSRICASHYVILMLIATITDIIASRVAPDDISEPSSD